MIPAQWKPAGGPTNSTLRSGPARSKRNREKRQAEPRPSQGGGPKVVGRIPDVPVGPGVLSYVSRRHSFGRRPVAAGACGRRITIQLGRAAGCACALTSDADQGPPTRTHSAVLAPPVTGPRIAVHVTTYRGPGHLQLVVGPL